MTQKQRILQAFQEKEDLMVYEIMAPRPNGLGISQYGARIKELREMGHPIVNVEPGHFKYSKEDQMAYNPTTNPRWKAMGDYLHGKAPKPKYYDMDLEELISRKETAEGWLKDHKDHPKYDEALERYEKICDEINLLEGRWFK